MLVWLSLARNAKFYSSEKEKKKKEGRNQKFQLKCLQECKISGGGKFLFKWYITKHNQVSK